MNSSEMLLLDSKTIQSGRKRLLYSPISIVPVGVVARFGRVQSTIILGGEDAGLEVLETTTVSICMDCPATKY